MKDGATAHKAKLAQNFLDANNMSSIGRQGTFHTWKCPFSSLYLNPIENIWPLLKQRVQVKGSVIRQSKEAIEFVIDAEWNRIAEEEIQNVINTMSKVIAAVIEDKDGHTRW